MREPPKRRAAVSLWAEGPPLAECTPNFLQALGAAGHLSTEGLSEGPENMLAIQVSPQSPFPVAGNYLDVTYKITLTPLKKSSI